jgi:hypothetical protein
VLKLEVFDVGSLEDAASLTDPALALLILVPTGSLTNDVEGSIVLSTKTRLWPGTTLPVKPRCWYAGGLAL